MSAVDRTLGAAEDGGEWRKVTRRRGRCGGQKARAQSKGGRGQRSGDGDGTVAVPQHTTGNGDGADEVRHQRAWDWDGTNGATAPPLAPEVAGCRGKGDAVRGWQGGGQKRARAAPSCLP